MTAQPQEFGPGGDSVNSAPTADAPAPAPNGNAGRISTGDPVERVYRSVADMFWRRVKEMPSQEAFRFVEGDHWRSLTWQQTAERVRAVAHGLLALGLEREQRCAILASTRIEWILVDMGIMCAGGATTTIYPSSTADDCSFILVDSDARIVIVEDAEQVAKVRSMRADAPNLAHIVVIDGTGVTGREDDGVITLAELEEKGRAYAAENADVLETIAEELTVENLATIIYTSGTTGRPKGVELLHDCWTYTAEATKQLGLLQPSDLQYLWLPLSHSFGKVLLSGQLAIGYASAVDGRIPKLVENLSVIRPTFMGAAPRIFEKVHNRVVGGAKEAGGLKWRIFRWALARGRAVSALRQKGQEPRGLLALEYRVADKLVFSKLKERFGGRVRFFISGSAPLAKDVAEFFHAADILVLEGYGLTETSAMTSLNVPNRYSFGSVGPSVPGTSVKIAEEDGEILIKSRGLMRGYHNMPEETKATLTEDGFLRSGDIGEIDAGGFVRITDRKKDLIKTSGGKYIAPQLIEGRLKALCPVVSQVIVHGDRRNYCTALITLDEESITGWAVNHGLAGLSYEELTRHQKVRGMVEGYIEELNKSLASFETIKHFSLLPKDLTIEDGELTPSLKVKRKAVEAKYMATLDEMYEAAAPAV